MKAEKGNRKLAATHQMSLLLLIGLIICLAAACFLFRGSEGKVDAEGAALTYKMFGIYALGLAGKLGLFAWGNAKEYEHAATTAKTEIKP